MNKRIKKLWIKALRSGKYKQGQNFLRSNGTYCCLGVLCDVYQKQTGEGEWEDRAFVATPSDLSSTELPRRVVRWAELEDSNPLLGRKLVASALNDGGKSFALIADRIEKYL